MSFLAPLVLTLALTPIAGPAPLAPGVRDSLVHAWTSSRTEEQEALRTSPSSYLAAVQRVDFGGAAPQPREPKKKPENGGTPAL